MLQSLRVLLTNPQINSLSWWADLADSWRAARVSAAVRACALHARTLTSHGAIVGWQDLSRLAELSLENEYEPSVHSAVDEAETRPQPAESTQNKRTRLWRNFEYDSGDEEADSDIVIDLNAVEMILRVRYARALTLRSWIQIWNYHSEPAVAIDHFFAATIGTDLAESFMASEERFMALLHLSESFQEVGEHAAAYAALMLLSAALASGADPRTTAANKKEWQAQVQEHMHQFSAPPADLYSPIKETSDIGIGFRMFDWFVAKEIPGRFLEFLGSETVSELALRYPLLKRRIELMARNIGWALEPSDDSYLAEIVKHPPLNLFYSVPLLTEPSTIAPRSRPKRPTTLTRRSAASRLPQPRENHENPVRDLSLDIGFQRAAAEISRMQLSFGSYNPLAIIHARARPALACLVEQLLRQGRAVIWVRDLKQDPNPSVIGAEHWAWTTRNSDEPNLLPVTRWPGSPKDRILDLLSTSGHISIREDLRDSLSTLLDWLVANPNSFGESGRRRRFLRCVNAAETGITLKGPHSLRRLAILVDSVMSCLDVLRQAASVDTRYYGRSDRPLRLAVFDTESEGLTNSLSFLLFIGGIIDAIGQRHEMDFELNARPRKESLPSDAEDESDESLEDKRARMNKLMIDKQRDKRMAALPMPAERVSDLCFVLSAGSETAISCLLDWTRPGAFGSAATLLMLLDRFPKVPSFLGGFQTFALGHLNEQERLLLRTSAGVTVPPMHSNSPADLLSVWKHNGGMSIRSGVLWPPNERRS